MLHHFDHRWGTYDGGKIRNVTLEEKQDPHLCVMPRYWIPKADVESRLTGRWDRRWLLGWRDITNTTNERTVIAGIVPRVGTGDTCLLMFPSTKYSELYACLVANLDSYILDYAARQKVGGTHLKYHVFKQLPILPPKIYKQLCPWVDHSVTYTAWIMPRVLELVYTSREMQPFALDCGYEGDPFQWNEERRFQLRCELDAAFFHLYGINRDDVGYILDTFPIIRRHDEKKYGEYRTKRSILDYYIP